MRYIAQISSFFVFLIGSLTSFFGKYSHAIDDSISLIAGIIGIIGGVVWISILTLKKKNERLEFEIKTEELKKLKVINK